MHDDVEELLGEIAARHVPFEVTPADRAVIDRHARMQAALPEDFQIRVDGRGHDTWRMEDDFGLHQEREGLGRLEITYFLGTVAPITDSQTDALVEAWLTRIPLREPIEIPGRYGYSCGWCKANEFVTDGFTISAREPCPHPNGFVTQVEMDFPSGRMVVGNDFRHKFTVVNDDFYVNEAAGIRECTEAYARIGMFHFFVGNSCPGVYRIGADRFQIANPASDGEDTEHPFPGEKVAGVVTDLWWVSIADGDEADRRGLAYKGSPTGEGHWTDNHAVAVTTGRYRLRSFVTLKGFDHDDYTKPIIYADLMRTGDVRD